MSAFTDETGFPRFGGANTGAELKRSIENASSKVFALLDNISASINLKMKYDGYFYNGYEFVFSLLHMNEFNQNEVMEALLKQSQSGGVNKFKVEASRGNTVNDVIAQAHLENNLFRDMFENLVVPPSSHTQTNKGGRPPMQEVDLKPAGEASRTGDTNDPNSRDT